MSIRLRLIQKMNKPERNIFTDSIASISTGLTESGIGIIRISGPEAFSIADRIYRSKSGKKLQEAADHTIHYGWIYDGDEMIDEVLVSIMAGPRTYTAEDTVEVNCHGGIYAMQRVLECVLKNGARLAEPGEFTKRAFLNGRIDLSRAEAVMDVIRAKNEYALKNSMQHLRGTLQRKITELRQDMLLQTATIESALDDPEHYTLDGFSEQLSGRCKVWAQVLQRLIESYDSGRVMQEGIRTVILGKPNAGKSSFLNCLMGQDRAILTMIPGTTRDILTETIRLGGMTLNIADTAGIRQTDDLVEQMGVEKARQAAADADLILYVVDSSVPLDENDSEILSLIKDRHCIILLNKSDLPPVIYAQDLIKRGSGHEVMPVCAKTGEGMEQLKNRIEEMFLSGQISTGEEICITSLRQKKLLTDAADALIRVEQSILAGMPEDFLSIDLMDAISSLGQITGEDAKEDLANRIFADFCMGK